ncbi:hypothetical protein DL765_004231 [Monosporascus sp. GIB2]|nr:hypothetical protein DL765_004231 [Monosporascus sp. GIB2]
MRGCPVQDAHPGAARPIHLPLFGLSQADELRIRDLRYISPISTPECRAALVLHTADRPPRAIHFTGEYAAHNARPRSCELTFVELFLSPMRHEALTHDSGKQKFDRNRQALPREPMLRRRGGRLSSEPKLTGRGQNKNVVSVKGGCLEGLDWGKAVHIWTKSAMVPIPEGAETHPEEPTGSEYSTSSDLSDRASDFPGTLIGSSGCGEPSGSRKAKLEETLRRITGACELSGPVSPGA